VKKILRHSFHITRWTIACMILAASLLLITARTFTSYIEDYANNIVDRMSIVLGVPVEVDSVSAEWHGLGPSVFLTGVRLGDGENTSSISSVIVKPDVVSSLFSLSIIWSRFEVNEMDVHLEELPSGRWSFAGIELGGGEGGGAYLEEMILESNQVAVREARFNIRSLLGSQLELHVHDMSLDYALAFHRLKLQADFGEAKNQLEFIAELTGTGSRFLDLDGLAYLKIAGHDIGELYERIQDEFWPEIDLNMVDKPSAQVELWANFRAGKQIEWQGSAVLDRIPASLLGYESGTPRFLTDLTGVYSTQSQFLNLQGAEIELYSDTIELPDAQINRSISVSEISNSEVDYSLTIPSVQISELLESLSDVPAFANSKAQEIVELNPVGELGLLYLEVPNLDFSRWQLSGQLKSVDVGSYRTAPAVKNLSGYFSLQNDRGSIQIDASDVSLFYPKVYDHWFEHDSIKGAVSWQIDFEDQNLFVFTDSLSVLGEHGPVSGAVLVDVPLKAGHPTGVDLTLFLGIKETSAEQKNNLLPSSLSADLRAWLDGAILAGDVPEAGFVYRGSTKRGQSARRTTQLRLHAVNGELKYADRWPEVTDLDAEIWVSNALVSGSAQSARLLDLNLLETSVEVKPVTMEGEKTNLINLSSTAQGLSSSLLDLVRTTGLRDQVGDSLDILKISGNVEAAVDLQLPTIKEMKREDVSIQVQANVLNNQLVLDKQKLRLDNISGLLTYGHEGLQAKGIRAEFWGRPLELDLAESLDAGLLGIDLQGRVEAKDVIEWLDLSFLDRLEGVTDVAGRIELRTQTGTNTNAGTHTDIGTNSQYHFWTDMLGITSSFPEPFSKSADKSAPLDIKVEVGELTVTSLGWDVVDGNNLDIESEANDFLFEISQYSDTEESSTVSEGSRAFQSARLSFQSQLPEAQEGLFSGQIRVADININECFEIYESEVLASTNQAGVYGTILGLKPDFALVADSFIYSETDFGRVKANLGFEPAAWKVNFQTDYASGDFYVFEDKQPPLINIASVDLNQVQNLFDSKDDSNKELEPDAGSLFDPGEIPHLQVNVESLVLNDIERGHWAGTLTPTENGLWIGDLSGGLDSALLAEEEGSSSLFWGLGSNGYYTEMDLTFEYGDIGDLFGLIEIDPPMSSNSGIFYASLNWNGAPYEFSESSLSGIMGVNAQNGSFHTGDSKVPNTLLKTIGLINVGSWVRRLRLDFNDMTASGTPYDLIVGDFVVEGEQITTLTPVDVELSSGSMLFDGVIDLGKEEVDARLVVTLPARQNVTWVAALVAGLPAAAGVWLAGKIFDDELDSLSSVSYKIGGALDDPKVSAQKMFESTITK